MKPLGTSARIRPRARSRRGETPRTPRPGRRVLLALAVLVVGPVLALFVASYLTPLPPELAEGRPPGTGAVLRDRHGVVLRELRAGDGMRARWVPLD